MRIFALLALVLALHAAELPFKMPAAYACDATFVDDGQKMTGRMVVGGPDKQRIEMKGPEGAVIMIMRKDLKKVHVLMPEMKMVMTTPIDAAMQQGFKDPTMDGSATWKKTGSETVNGVACDRYEWSSGDDKGVTWIDAKQGVMIRSYSGGKDQADFTNYQIGAQKADLFEVPAGYQPMPGMGGMMGGK